MEGSVTVPSGRDWQNPISQPRGNGLERVVGAKLRQISRITGQESAFLLRHAPGPCKVTVPSAGYLGSRNYPRGVTDKVYPEVAGLLADIAAIIVSRV